MTGGGKVKLFGRKQSLGWVPFEAYSVKMTLLTECIEMKRVFLVGSLLFLLAGCRTTLQGTVPVQEAATVVIPGVGPTEILNPMPASRTAGAAVTLGDYIYLIGGITSQAHVILPTWRYDPANDTWTAVAPLLQPREHVDAVALDGLIYALSGRWIETLNTVEIYDPVKDQWTPGVPMKDKRAGFGATLMNGKIY